MRVACRFVLFYLALLVISLKMIGVAHADGEVDESLAGSSPTRQAQRAVELRDLRLRLLASLSHGVTSGKFADFDAYAHQLHQAGFSGDPELSQRLLFSARLEQEQKSSDSGDDFVTPLVKAAVVISPEDPLVLLSTLGFISNIGLADSLNNLIAGLCLVKNYPSLGVRVLVVGLLLFGLVTTLSWTLTAMVQVIVNLERLYEGVCSWFDVSYRGLVVIPILIVLLLLPILGGILFAVVFWALSLAVILGNRWLYAVGALALVLFWTVSFEKLLNFDLQLSSNNLTLERMNAGSLVVGESDLVTQYEKEPLAGIVVVQYLAKVGKVELAQKLIELLPQKFKFRDPGVEREYQWGKAYARATLDLLKGQAKPALERYGVLVEQGVVDFSLYLNMAQASLALFDVSSQKQFMSKALELDPKRFDSISLQESEGEVLPLALPVSGRSLFLELFLTERDSQRVDLVSDQVSERALSQLLALPRGPWLSAFVLAGGLVLFVSWLSHYLRRKRETGSAETETSLKWALLPGGYFFGGSSPVLGAVLLAVFLSSAVVFSGQFTLLRIDQVEPGWERAVSGAIMLFAFGLSLFVSICIAFRRKSVG